MFAFNSLVFTCLAIIETSKCIFNLSSMIFHKTESLFWVPVVKNGFDAFLHTPHFRLLGF